MRAKELEELGYEELEMCRATFVMREQEEVIAILCLHVDDGFLTTAPERMPKAQTKINSKFNIKEWQNISEGTTILGVKTRLHNNTFEDYMSEYVSKVQPAEVRTGRQEELKGEQLSAYTRLIM